MSEQELEIEKTLVISSSHITEKDSEMLRNGSVIVSYECEFFFLIPLLDQILEEMGDHFSPAFKKLVAFVKNHNEKFTHLKLDRDGFLLPGFETFDW